MAKIKNTHSAQGISFLAIPAATMAAVLAGFLLNANAQTPAKPAADKKGNAAASLVGDVARGEEHFEATCAECHGPAATAPTLRGIINRPIASVAAFYGYSEALKAKAPATWTPANLDAYLKSPPTFAPGNLMYREYPDAQMRADVIAFLASLPPPR